MRARHATAEEPLRIAMVAACPFPSLRGSQVLIRELAQALADRGHTVHVVTYPQGESLVAVHGIRVHRAHAPWFAARGWPWVWRRLVLDVSLALALYRIVRQAQIQVIHAHNYEAPLASFLVRWMTGVPVVYHSHNALSDELAYYVAPGWRRRLAHHLGSILDRQVPRRADYSIALTCELESFLRRCGVTKVATISPTSAPPPAGVHDGSGGFAGRFAVMYTGNLDPYQDLDVLWAGVINLLAVVPETLLLVVTHEVNWERRGGSRLVQLVEAGAAQVIVAPTFSAVRRLMARADVLVCPRRSWSGFPIKLLNYMVAGRPIVAAEGSAKGMIDGETGLVFRNGDAEDLASVLRRLAYDPTLRVRCGERARTKALEAGTRQRNIEQIEGIYARIRAVDGGAMGAVAKETRLRGLIAFSKDRISAASGEMPR